MDDAVVTIEETTDFSFLDDSIILPQTQYLDQYTPDYFLQHVRDGQCLYTPYGYCMRQVDPMMGVIATDPRFGGGIIPQIEHFKKSLHRRRFVHTGHTLIWALSNQRNPTDIGPTVCWQFHWTEQQCSLAESIDLLEKFANRFHDRFGSQVLLRTHPFLQGVGFEVPIEYSAFRNPQVVDRLRGLVSDGVVVVDKSLLSHSLPTYDLLIADGASIIAYAAALGTHISTPTNSPENPFLPRITALPHFTRHEPRQVDACMKHFMEIIESQFDNNEAKKTYFNHFEVSPHLSPVEKYLNQIS